MPFRDTKELSAIATGDRAYFEECSVFMVVAQVAVSPIKVGSGDSDFCNAGRPIRSRSIAQFYNCMHIRVPWMLGAGLAKLWPG